MNDISYTEFLEYCVENGYTGTSEELQEAYNELVYESNNTDSYTDLLEFFVENGIFLDNDQLNALQEFKSDEKAYYDTRRALEKMSAMHMSKDEKAANKNMMNNIRNYGSPSKRSTAFLNKYIGASKDKLKSSDNAVKNFDQYLRRQGSGTFVSNMANHASRMGAGKARVERVRSGG